MVKICGTLLPCPGLGPNISPLWQTDQGGIHYWSLGERQTYSPWHSLQFADISNYNARILPQRQFPEPIESEAREVRWQWQLNILLTQLSGTLRFDETVILWISRHPLSWPVQGWRRRGGRYLCATGITNLQSRGGESRLWDRSRPSRG